MDLNTAVGPIEAFLDSGVAHPTLGLVYGRRRIGKSTLLVRLSAGRGGFYWEATRGEPAVHLQRLGSELGAHLGVGSLALADWGEAVAALLRLGSQRSVPVVVDEFGYLLEADPTIDSVVAASLGPAARQRSPGTARLILCGSAIALMRDLTAGEATLRGRAGMEIVMQPLDDRGAARFLGDAVPLDLAARVYAVIGGVVGYYTDMVDRDLPTAASDFDRWVAARVLSPAATLHHEATTLLAEDPTLAAGSAGLHHSILAAIANGSVTAGGIANRLRRSVPNLDPALKRLTAAGFVLRHEDPLRSQRPTYRLADPFLQFHYAVLEPHGALLRERDVQEAWKERLSAAFESRVRGPVFEEQARSWARRHALPATVGDPHHPVVGPSVVAVDGVERQLDVVVGGSPDAAAAPTDRAVHAIGEAKAGRTLGVTDLRSLERARAALGPRAAHARLLLCAPAFSRELEVTAAGRSDVDLVDLDRLYHGG